MKTIFEEIRIPTNERPIEGFALHDEERPSKAILIIPGQGYTINNFVLDFIWRMAAEKGYYSVKAEYRGYTYRHLGEPYDAEHAVEDLHYMVEHLKNIGYSPKDIVICAKSLGTLALAGLLAQTDLCLDKAILLTPVLYFNQNKEIIQTWQNYMEKVKASYIAFGGNDPLCDLQNAQKIYTGADIDFYPGLDHGLCLDGDYQGTIEIQKNIIERAREFIKQELKKPM